MDGVLAYKSGNHRLYPVRVVDSMNGEGHAVTVLNAHSMNDPCSLEMRHNRFGHTDTNAIRLMAKQELVDGLKIMDSSLLGKCEMCLVAKTVFDAIVVPSNEFLECVSPDLWGKARILSIGKATYMLLACEDLTGVSFPYFSFNKEVVMLLKLVENFVTMAEIQT